MSKATPRTYEVSVEGEEGQFGVIAARATYFPGGLGTGGIAVIVVVVLILAIALVFSRIRRI